MKIVIKNGRVIDPKNKIDDTLDVFIEDGIIKNIANNIKEEADKIIDATGKIVCPGFIDIHVHFRSPGQEHKEDFLTGSYAAAAGGFTTVCTMANTNPIIDSPELIKKALEKAKTSSIIRVLPFGSITYGMKNGKLVDVNNMLEEGCIGFSEDGMSVRDNDLMRQILSLSAEKDFPVLCHCEDPYFSDGIVNEGPTSEKLGVKGIPSEVEDIIVGREILIAGKTKGHAHITHTSTFQSIELIRQAKKEGVNVTSDVTPHHFSLDESYVLSGDTNFKMNPPLRSKKDVEGIIKGIIDGTVDCIATDHAPHSKEEKNQPIDKAPFGIIGLETALSVSIKYLIEPGHIDFTKLIELLSVNPAKIARLDAGHLSKNSCADITIFDPNKEIVIDETFFKSKSKNSPYIGMKLKGEILTTISNGKIVYNNGSIIK